MRLHAAAHASGSRLSRPAIASRASSALTPASGPMLRSARRMVSCFSSSSERGPQLCANERDETATSTVAAANCFTDASFGRFFRPWGSAADLDDRLDLDRDAVGQRSHADGRAGVLALVAEHLDEQVRAAVDHLGLVGELRRAVHHAEQLHHALDAVEAAQFGLHHREQREPDRARVLVALLDAELGAELAFHRARALAGEKQQVAGAHGVHVVGDRRARRGELDAQLLETFFRAHGRETTFPGFIRLSGSNNFLMSRIRPITSSPSSACSEPCLPMPMPCSPVQVPSMASARSTSRALRAFASSSSARLLGSIRITRWKLPSPTWPKSGIGMEAFSISLAVCVTHSASREIGTHTSVDTAREPGLSCRHAK